MVMLVIRTQVYENYAWNEDGSIGTGPDAYWKAKGGSEYKVLNVPLNTDYEAIVSLADVERDDDYFREHVIDWSIESDDYLSWFEKSQLEYDGSITCKEPTMEYSDLIEERMVA
jgi:hypothetical protein